MVLPTMDKDFQELIQYISTIDKPCADDILCSIEQVQMSLTKVLAHFREKIKAEVDENSFDDVGQLATYCNQLKEICNVLGAVVNHSSDSIDKRLSFPKLPLEAHTDIDVDDLLDEEFL